MNFSIALASTLLFVCVASAQSTRPATFNVRDFGAVGDGKHLDSPAIDRAITAAAERGGGTVFVPAGDYLAVTIHLRSHIAIHLDAGSTIIAADANPKAGIAYDPPEPNKFDIYQDFGHSHWHNSLFVGENLHDIALIGPGAIYGKGLLQYARQIARTSKPIVAGKFGFPNTGDTIAAGWANKAVALKRCNNVLIRDVVIRHGGHFAILATGVDNLVLDNLKIDTNRDGIDLDCCRNVRVLDCSVNSPFDDGICPKSSFALGEARATENITISNCQVSGYAEGEMIDGTFDSEHSHGGVGRIKLGTESNGGFKNIAISNCLFDHCHGLALETVDGGTLENIVINNIAMRDIIGPPIFLRLGSRLRGPEGTKVGALRHVSIANIVIHNADPGYASIISGIPDADIEDVAIKNIRIDSMGGGTRQQAAERLPEREDAYPESTMFGQTPAFAFFIRHAKAFELSDVTMQTTAPDARPAVYFEDVAFAHCVQIDTFHLPGTPAFVLNEVRDFILTGCAQTPDKHIAGPASEHF